MIHLDRAIERMEAAEQECSDALVSLQKIEQESEACGLSNYLWALGVAADALAAHPGKTLAQLMEEANGKYDIAQGVRDAAHDRYYRAKMQLSTARAVHTRVLHQAANVAGKDVAGKGTSVERTSDVKPSSIRYPCIRCSRRQQRKENQLCGKCSGELDYLNMKAGNCRCGEAASTVFYQVNSSGCGEDNNRDGYVIHALLSCDACLPAIRADVKKPGWGRPFVEVTADQEAIAKAYLHHPLEGQKYFLCEGILLDMPYYFLVNGKVHNFISKRGDPVSGLTDFVDALFEKTA